METKDWDWAKKEIEKDEQLKQIIIEAVRAWLEVGYLSVPIVKEIEKEDF